MLTKALLIGIIHRIGRAFENHGYDALIVSSAVGKTHLSVKLGSAELVLLLADSSEGGTKRLQVVLTELSWQSPKLISMPAGRVVELEGDSRILVDQTLTNQDITYDNVSDLLDQGLEYAQ